MNTEVKKGHYYILRTDYPDELVESFPDKEVDTIALGAIVNWGTKYSSKRKMFDRKPRLALDVLEKKDDMGGVYYRVIFEGLYDLFWFPARILTTTFPIHGVYPAPLLPINRGETMDAGNDGLALPLKDLDKKNIAKAIEVVNEELATKEQQSAAYHYKNFLNEKDRIARLRKQASEAEAKLKEAYPDFK